jgi:uncharacterized protein
MSGKQVAGAVMLVVTAACGLVIGLVIGGLGGGGGVLTVPVLVYLLGQTAQDATTSSVIIVGISSAVGVLSRIRGHGVAWRTGLALAAAGTPAAYAGSILNQRAGETTLLLAFAALTLLVGTAMLVDGGPCDDDPDGPRPGDGSAGVPLVPGPAAVVVRPPGGRRLAAPAVAHGVKIVMCGAAAGFLTGFLGVGGGFLVVPALVIVLRMPMNRDVGTALLVILVNTVAALGSRWGATTLDWAVLVPFTLASVAGTVLGRRVAARLSGAVLTRTFAGLVLLVGLAVGAETVVSWIGSR